MLIYFRPILVAIILDKYRDDSFSAGCFAEIAKPKLCGYCYQAYCQECIDCLACRISFQKKFDGFLDAFISVFYPNELIYSFMFKN